MHFHSQSAAVHQWRMAIQLKGFYTPYSDSDAFQKE